MHRPFFAVIMIFAAIQASAATKTEAEFEPFADDYIKGHLDWRPGDWVGLGLHEYDGKITDYSRASIDAERARLRKAERTLSSISEKKLSPAASCDYRLLQSAIRKELFRFDDLQAYSRNPMVYARAIEVLIYVKRDFAPLPDRVR